MLLTLEMLTKAMFTLQVHVTRIPIFLSFLPHIFHTKKIYATVFSSMNCKRPGIVPLVQ